LSPRNPGDQKIDRGGEESPMLLRRGNEKIICNTSSEKAEIGVGIVRRLQCEPKSELAFLISTKSRRKNLCETTLLFSLQVIVLTLGAVLLHDGVSHPDAGQSAKIIGGAAFLSLGSITMLIVLR
jgi:hypothetical protein